MVGYSPAHRVESQILSFLRSLVSRFKSNQSGNFAMVMALLIVPIGIAIGLGVDYARASNARATMQSALDAAAWYGAAMPLDTTEANRLSKMQAVYAANGGTGTVSIAGYEQKTNSIALKVTGAAEVPLTFMRLAKLTKVAVDVNAQVQLPIKLKTATFKVTKARGYWAKTLSLYGRHEKTGNYDKLMTMEYPESVGVTRRLSDIPIYKWTGDTKTRTTDGVIDVGEYDSLYMRMDITSSSERVLRDLLSGLVSNITTLLTGYTVTYPSTILSYDPNYVGRMYATPVVNGSAVTSKLALNNNSDIYARLGCGDTEQQNWEDGGSLQTKQVGTLLGKKNYVMQEGLYGAGEPSATIANRDTITDFGYWVTGRCDVAVDDGARLVN